MEKDTCPLCKGSGTIQHRILKKSTKFKGGEIAMLQNILLTALDESPEENRPIVGNLINKLYRPKNALWDGK